MCMRIKVHFIPAVSTHVYAALHHGSIPRPRVMPRLSIRLYCQSELQNYATPRAACGLSLDAHAHNVERNLHVTIERQPDGSTSLFEMLPCERLPCFFELVDLEEIFFEKEAHNFHSKAAIKVKLDTDGSVIGHVPDGLAAVLAPLLASGTMTSVTGTTTGPPRSVAEGVWTDGGGIELPCEYALHSTKKDRMPINVTPHPPCRG